MSKMLRVIILIASVALGLTPISILSNNSKFLHEAHLNSILWLDDSFAKINLVACLQMVTALGGICMTVSHAQNGAKIIALSACLNILAVLFGASNQLPALDDGYKQIVGNLERLQGKFDWTANWDGFSKSDDLSVRNATLVWTWTQRDLKCCGLFEYDDWKFVPAKGVPPSKKVPASCFPRYASHNRGELFPTGKGSQIYRTPCSKRIDEMYEKASSLIGRLIWINIALFVAAIIMGRPETRPNEIVLQKNYQTV